MHAKRDRNKEEIEALHSLRRMKCEPIPGVVTPPLAMRDEAMGSTRIQTAATLSSTKAVGLFRLPRERSEILLLGAG